MRFKIAHFYLFYVYFHILRAAWCVLNSAKLPVWLLLWKRAGCGGASSWTVNKYGVPGRAGGLLRFDRALRSGWFFWLDQKLGESNESIRVFVIPVGILSISLFSCWRGERSLFLGWYASTVVRYFASWRRRKSRLSKVVWWRITFTFAWVFPK